MSEFDIFEGHDEQLSWADQMRLRYHTRAEMLARLGVRRHGLEWMLMTDKIGYVVIGTCPMGYGRTRRLVRYATHCRDHDSYLWCEHNGGCFCTGTVHAPHPPGGL